MLTLCLAGLPSAGKSTMINALAGKRVLESELPDILLRLSYAITLDDAATALYNKVAIESKKSEDSKDLDGLSFEGIMADAKNHPAGEHFDELSDDKKRYYTIMYPELHSLALLKARSVIFDTYGKLVTYVPMPLEQRFNFKEGGAEGGAETEHIAALGLVPVHLINQDYEEGKKCSMLYVYGTREGIPVLGVRGQPRVASIHAELIRMFSDSVTFAKAALARMGEEGDEFLKLVSDLPRSVFQRRKFTKTSVVYDTASNRWFVHLIVDYMPACAALYYHSSPEMAGSVLASLMAAHTERALRACVSLVRMARKAQPSVSFVSYYAETKYERTEKATRTAEKTERAASVLNAANAILRSHNVCWKAKRGKRAESSTSNGQPRAWSRSGSRK